MLTYNADRSKLEIGSEFDGGSLEKLTFCPWQRSLPYLLLRMMTGNGRGDKPAGLILILKLVTA